LRRAILPHHVSGPGLAFAPRFSHAKAGWQVSRRFVAISPRQASSPGVTGEAPLLSFCRTMVAVRRGSARRTDHQWRSNVNATGSPARVGRRPPRRIRACQFARGLDVAATSLAQFDYGELATSLRWSPAVSVFCRRAVAVTARSTGRDRGVARYDDSEQCVPPLTPAVSAARESRHRLPLSFEG